MACSMYRQSTRAISALSLSRHRAPRRPSQWRSRAHAHAAAAHTRSPAPQHELREALDKALVSTCRNPAVLCMSSWKSLRSRLAVTPLGDQMPGYTHRSAQVPR
jgi:hypothetical protein